MRRGQFMCLRDDVRVGGLEVACRLGFGSGQQDGRAKKSKCASASSLFVVLKYTMLYQKTVTIPLSFQLAHLSGTCPTHSRRRRPTAASRSSPPWSEGRNDRSARVCGCG